MNRIPWLLIATLLWFLPGCSPQKPPAVQETSAAGAPQPSWRLKLDIPESINAGKPVDVALRVFDAGGQPVDNAQAELSLVMTSMDMGENKPVLAETAPGTYTGKATFTMAGPWEVIARVGKGGQSISQRFPCNVR
jgi:hypothetical protein